MTQAEDVHRKTCVCEAFGRSQHFRGNVVRDDRDAPEGPALARFVSVEHGRGHRVWEHHGTGFRHSQLEQAVARFLAIGQAQRKVVRKHDRAFQRLVRRQRTENDRAGGNALIEEAVIKHR
ncbi:hypothetical protein D3C86_1149680 [compost metagenome]